MHHRFQEKGYINKRLEGYMPREINKKIMFKGQTESSYKETGTKDSIICDTDICKTKCNSKNTSVHKQNSGFGLPNQDLVYSRKEAFEPFQTNI